MQVFEKSQPMIDFLTKAGRLPASLTRPMPQLVKLAAQAEQMARGDFAHKVEMK